MHSLKVFESPYFLVEAFLHTLQPGLKCVIIVLINLHFVELLLHIFQLHLQLSVVLLKQLDLVCLVLSEVLLFVYNHIVPFQYTNVLDKN